MDVPSNLPQRYRINQTEMSPHEFGEGRLRAVFRVFAEQFNILTHGCVNTGTGFQTEQSIQRITAENDHQRCASAVARPRWGYCLAATPCIPIPHPSR